VRRSRAAAAAAVLALAGAALVARYVWLPGYRPALRAGEEHGIDVSAHQGAVDWRRVRADGIAFAYLKATEGGDHTDRRFAENWAGAAAAGLPRGAYHFFTLCRPGADQARHFLAVAGRGELPPAVDLELAGNCSARPPREAVAAELAAFLALVERATGERVVLYLGEDWQRAYPVDRGGRPLWLRRVLRRPSGDWSLWQVGGWSRVDGVAGPVDLDVRRVR
jgi:lysozyme